METRSSSLSPIYSKLKSWGLKPLVLDFYIQNFWSTFSLERILARVKSEKRAADNIVSLRIKPNFNFRNFQAGQHVLVTTAVNGQRFTRTYSPTLLRDGSLEFTVKRIENGKVSSQLGRYSRRRSIVELSQPFGDMTWARLPESASYAFCAGGVGITPLRSLIRAWDENELLHARAIELHYWAKTEGEFCFAEELHELASRRANFKLHFYRTSESKTDVAAVLPKSAATVVVACGPQGFVNAVRESAEANGQKFFGEHAQSAMAQAANLEEEVFFDLNYAGQALRASSKKTLLETLEANGFSPVHGCRMGLCKSCTCTKREGVTFNSKDQRETAEANAEIQICVSTPRSSLVLEEY